MEFDIGLFLSLEVELRPRLGLWSKSSPFVGDPICCISRSLSLEDIYFEQSSRASNIQPHCEALTGCSDQEVIRVVGRMLRVQYFYQSLKTLGRN